MRLQADQLKPLQLVAGGLIAGSVLFLAVALYVRSLGTLGSVEMITYLAAAYALPSPFIAAMLRHRILSEASGLEPSPEAIRRAVILSFGILDGAAFLCGLALLLGTTHWPLAAAAVPLATMVAWFPRADAP